MWPWEHVLFAYIVYSVYRHARWGRGPSGLATVALAIGSLAPDLIDKPLAWEFGLVGSEYAIGHSVFFAVGLCSALFALAASRGRPGPASGFACGYLMHLVGDVVPISIRRGELYVDHLFWPVMRTGGAERHGSFLEASQHHFSRYAGEIASLDPSPHVALQLGIVGLGLLLWALDGFPGIPRTVPRRRASPPSDGS